MQYRQNMGEAKRDRWKGAGRVGRQNETGRKDRQNGTDRMG
jgi:hypothetical protein